MVLIVSPSVIVIPIPDLIVVPIIMVIRNTIIVMDINIPTINLVILTLIVIGTRNSILVVVRIRCPISKIKLILKVDSLTKRIGFF